MVPQKTANNQHDLEKEEEPSGGITLPNFKQRYSDQIVWCWHKKKTLISMKQTKEPRNKPMCLWSIYLQQRS